jgi:hypothetical protein
MDALEIAVIIGLCLKMALTAVALTMVYKMRFSTSKGTRKLKREGGQREESAREEKTESRPVRKSSSGRDIHKRAVSSGKKQLKPGPAASEVQKQVQPKNTAPVKSAEPTVASKNESVSRAVLPGAPQQPSAVTEPKSGVKPPGEPSAGNTSGGEKKRINPITFSPRNKAGEQIERTEVRKQVQPKNTAPVKSAKTMAASKDGSVKHTAFLGPPQPQAAFTVSKSGEKPHREPSAGNTSPAGIAKPAQMEKESEASMDTKPGTEGNQASSEPPAATTDSGETDQETPQTGKSGLGDLADLFATSASEFTEKNKLAEQVNEVDVNDILQEGLGLLGKVKKSDD